MDPCQNECQCISRASPPAPNGTMRAILEKKYVKKLVTCEYRFVLPLRTRRPLTTSSFVVGSMVRWFDAKDHHSNGLVLQYKQHHHEDLWNGVTVTGLSSKHQ
jgi:hypothetical protein